MIPTNLLIDHARRNYQNVRAIIKAHFISPKFTCFDNLTRRNNTKHLFTEF